MRKNNGGVIVAAAVVIMTVLLFSYVCINNGGENDLSGEVFIIHTNDTHGYYDEYMGFTAVAALRDDYVSRGATVFLVDAGDAFQGTATTMLTHGKSTLEVMNSVGYDLMVPGNHEFDYGLETYLGYVSQLNFDTVCANLVWGDTGEPLFDAYTILEKDGFRLGVFGLITPDTMTSVFAGYLDDVEFTDPVEAASEAVAALQAEDVDMIVCIGHIGIDRSSTVNSDWICTEVDSIDVFIDGHDHTVMEHGKVSNGSIELIPSDTLIASTGNHIQYVGVVHLTAEGGPDACLVDMVEGSNVEVDSAISGVKNKLQNQMSQVVGYTETELHGERQSSRTKETTMGDFVTDTLRKLTGADIAVYNGGAFRASIHPGEITAEMVYNVIPFENYILTKTINGRQVWDIMEASVSHLPDADSGYLQVSGILVTYDSSRDAFYRVLSITFSDGTILDMDAEYILVSNDFVMAGGDGYEWLGDIKVDGMYGLVFDAIFDRFAQLGIVTTNDITIGKLTDVSF